MLIHRKLPASLAPGRHAARAALAGLVALAACSADDEPDPPAPFEPRPTIAAIGPDPLAGTGLESCPVYLDERCAAGKRQRCEIVDPSTKSPVASPDPLLRRVLLYDRWYDRYASPLGLTMERVFNGPVAPDAPESEWGAFERFDSFTGRGDSAIWTGAALMAAIFRYAETRTEADYRRMEEKTRVLLRNFEVTGIPGYLARYHFLLLPEGGPRSDQLILRHGAEATLGNVDLEIPSLAVDGLPPEYARGVSDGQGGFVQGKAYWNGDTSIDQYTGPMTAFPIVWSMLRDEKLKERIAYQMTCYLKRLQRIEIVNLRFRPDLVEEVKTAFGGSILKLDPDDPKVDELDRMVWYVHPGVNRRHPRLADASCPAKLNLEPVKVIDARSDTFELDLLHLASQINRENRTLPDQIDHFYIVSLRGGDASHLMHLAAMAYYFTKEEQYKAFLFDELIANLRANDVARTMMAFRLPDWCFKFYGDHITYGTHWQLVTMLPDSDLKNEMIRVMEEEAWQKAMLDHKSAKFNVMYASVVPDGVATARAAAIAEAIEQLEDFGGGTGTSSTIDAPRRTYTRSRRSIIDALPSGISLRCPTEAERMSCERGGTLLGFPLEGQIISRECQPDRPGQCTMQDGKCTDAIATKGLPARLRKYADFMWQRSPFDIGDRHSPEGQVQSPGVDLSEPYWLARYYDNIGEGNGHVLAWTDAAASCQ